MIYTDHAQRQVVRLFGQLHRDGRLVEGRVDVVDRDRVVWVGRIAAYVAYDRELAVGRGKRLRINERRNLCVQIDAVDEDIRLYDLGVGSWFGLGFREVPFLKRSVTHPTWHPCNLRGCRSAQLSHTNPQPPFRTVPGHR